MRRLFVMFLVLFIATLFSFQTASAQFPKIPKILKAPPTPVATPEPGSPTEPDAVTRSESTAGSSRSGGPYAVKPEPPANPQFLPETLEVGVEHWEYHYKIPNDNHHTSWAPRINFNVFYGGSTKLRLKAEYFMPDGTPWFSEPLEDRGSFDSSSGTSRIASDSGSDRDKKAIVAGGLFGIKIINMRDSSTLFQGKFKVVRYKPKNSDARYKDEVDYYVDYDWKLPIAITDIDWSSRNAVPKIRMWFKGDLKTDGFEARLIHDGKQIATTDDGGSVGSGERYYADKRGDDESLFWREVVFSWPGRAAFLVAGNPYEGTLFINQMPGEYTVKVFYNGDQVRETKFSTSNGNYADNGIAKQAGLTTNKVFLPVKVMGTLDKWNPVNAKAMGFYGNPVTGIP